MTEHDWHTTYTDAVKRFGGDTPGAQLEQQILDAFTEQPQLVIRAIDKVSAKYAAGHINSPWGAMKHEVQRATNQPHVIAIDSTDRNRAIQHAEQWIRAAGIHFDRDTEIMLELFGDLGQLRTYTQVDYQQTGLNEQGHPIWGLTEPRGDIALLERMTKLYHDVRPAGITIETDAIERAQKWKQQHTARQALAQAQAEAAIDNHEQAPLTDIDYAADNHPPGDLHDHATGERKDPTQ